MALRGSAIWTAALLAVAGAHGVGSSQTGGIVDRDRIDRAPPGALVPGAPPTRGPAQADAAPANALFPPFVLRSVMVDGSSLDRAVLMAAYQPFIGQQMDARGLNRIAQAIVAAYAKSDIALYTVSIPCQDFAEGRLGLRVIEGHVESGAVHVDGSQKVLRRLTEQIDPLTHEKPLTRTTLERRLSLMRDLPGVTLKADMQRTPRVGAVRMAVDATQKVYDLALSVTTNGSALLGRTQATLEATLYGLVRGGNATKLAFGAPIGLRGFQYYSVSHSQRVGAEGMVVSGGASYLRTRPKGTTLRGSAQLANLQVSYPVIRGYNRSLYVSGGIDGVNSRNAVLGQIIANERIRAVRGSVAYGTSNPKRVMGLSAVVSQGVDGLDSNVTDPRAAKPDFSKLNGQASFDRALGSRWVMHLRAAGQYSGDPLPTSELFSFGGDSFGRAFEASYISGDSGYAGSAELAYRPQAIKGKMAGTEVYSFVDGGRVTINRRYGTQRSFDMASGGAGVRLAYAQKYVLQIEAARALKDTSPLRHDEWRIGGAFRSLF